MKYEIVPDTERRLAPRTGRKSPEWDEIAAAVLSGSTIRVEASARQAIDNALRLRRGIDRLVISKHSPKSYTVWQEAPHER